MQNHIFNFRSSNPMNTTGIRNWKTMWCRAEENFCSPRCQIKAETDEYGIELQGETIIQGTKIWYRFLLCKHIIVTVTN